MTNDQALRELVSASEAFQDHYDKAAYVDRFVEAIANARAALANAAGTWTIEWFECPHCKNNVEVPCPTPEVPK